MAVTAGMLARAAATALSNEKLRKGIGWGLVAVLSPVILLIAALCSIGTGGADHNIFNYSQVGVTGFEPATSWSQTRRSSQAEPHPVNKVSRFAFNPFALDARFIILHCFRFVNTFFHFFQNVFCVVLFSPDNKEILSYLFSSVNT